MCEIYFYTLLYIHCTTFPCLVMSAMHSLLFIHIFINLYSILPLLLTPRSSTLFLTIILPFIPFLTLSYLFLLLVWTSIFAFYAITTSIITTHSYHYSYQYCLVTKHLLYYIEYIVLEIHTYPYLSHLTMFLSLRRCLHSRSLRLSHRILIRLCCHLLKSLLKLHNQHGLTRDTCQIRSILPTHAIFLYLQT